MGFLALILLGSIMLYGVYDRPAVLRSLYDNSPAAKKEVLGIASKRALRTSMEQNNKIWLTISD